MTDRITELARETFRDLQDRHMLIPVIALVAAIIAVPLLAGGGGSSDATAPVAPAAESTPASMTGSAEVDPVVLTEVPGLRDYRERLDRFSVRNPFKQQMTGGPSTAATDTSSTSTSTGGGSSSSSSSSAASSTSTVPPAADTSGSTTDTSGGTTSGGGVSHETKFFEVTLDVRVGRPGNAKVLKGVSPLSFLPGKESPVVQYIQGDFGATKAAFVVSPDVASTEGDGNCAPGRNNCRFLLLSEGDEQFFDYGPKLKVYKLEILSIQLEEIDPKSAKELGRDAVEASDAAAHFVAEMTK